jgi:DNA-binding NtrC family response regulator
MAMTSKHIPHILIIDDELPICMNCIKILEGMECAAEYALNGYDAMEVMRKKQFDVVVTDLKMARLGGMEVLKRIKESFPETVVIIMTGYASVSSAVEVMKMGAFDYLPKPFTPHEFRSLINQSLLQIKIKRQNKELMREVKPQPISHQLIGNSKKIKKVINMVQKVAPTDATVLLYGESGTGKELIARAVHANSNRKDNVFFAVDCGNLSGQLLESELFGYVKGAFTGANTDKEGIFQLAHQGTIFLDEISNTNMEVQGKLLRFLETMEFLPVGGTKIKKVDVRLIFATNKNLEEMVANGSFREDFYYRIFVYPINLPTLKERKSDILPIAYFFLNQHSKNIGKQIKGFDDEAANQLMEFGWPGNVRQLKNVIERAVILCDKDEITLTDLPILGEASEIKDLMENVPQTNTELKLVKKEIREKAIQRVEKNFLLHALASNDWNVTKASKKTGLQRTNFQGLMKKYGITRPSGSKTSD